MIKTRVILSVLAAAGLQLRECTPASNTSASGGFLDRVEAGVGDIIQGAKDFHIGCKISLAGNTLPLTTACGKDVFELGSKLLPILVKSASTDNQTSHLDDIINVTANIIKNYCTNSCSPAIVKFFKSIRENVDCNNTTLIETRIGNPTAYQIASGLIVGNALVCTNSASCIMDQINTARSLIAQHPGKIDLGTDLLSLLSNKTFVCNECTRSQSAAVQAIPISNLDEELQGNMQFFVGKLNERCTLNQGFEGSNSSTNVALNGSPVTSDANIYTPLTFYYLATASILHFMWWS